LQASTVIPSNETETPLDSRKKLTTEEVGEIQDQPFV
jgi:hypothetical protein